MTEAQLDQLSINTIRTLSIDAVQQAKSGHPGTPMGLALTALTVWLVPDHSAKIFSPFSSSVTE